jgi:hypothetical protein
MSNNHCLGYSLFAFLILIAPCLADELLWTRQGTLFTPNLNSPTPISVQVEPPEADASSFAVWTQDFNPSTVPDLFTMTRETIGDTMFYRFNHWMFNAPDGVDAFVRFPWMGIGALPPIESTQGFHLSRLELSIDSVGEITALNNLPVNFSFHVYGLPGIVPEPSVSAFLAMALCSGLGNSRVWRQTLRRDTRVHWSRSLYHRP